MKSQIILIFLSVILNVNLLRSNQIPAFNYGQIGNILKKRTLLYQSDTGKIFKIFASGYFPTRDSCIIYAQNLFTRISPDTIKSIRKYFHYGTVNSYSIYDIEKLFQLAYSGELKDTSIFIKLKNFAEAQYDKNELGPCDYYCVYDFGYNYLRYKYMPTLSLAVINGYPKWGFLDELSVVAEDSMIYFLNHRNRLISFDALTEMTLNYKKYNVGPGFDEFAFEWFGFIQYLGYNSNSEKAILELFIADFCHYGGDASGDGGVNEIQTALYRIAQRMHTTKTPKNN